MFGESLSGNFQDEINEELPAFLTDALRERTLAQLQDSGNWQSAGSWWNKHGENVIDVLALSRDAKTLLAADARLTPDAGMLSGLRTKVAAFLAEHPELSGVRVKYCCALPEEMRELRQ